MILPLLFRWVLYWENFGDSWGGFGHGSSCVFHTVGTLRPVGSRSRNLERSRRRTKALGDAPDS
jgi:hypothetical protein